MWKFRLSLPMVKIFMKQKLQKYRYFTVFFKLFLNVFGYKSKTNQNTTLYIFINICNFVGAFAEVVSFFEHKPFFTEKKISPYECSFFISVRVHTGTVTLRWSIAQC